MERYNKGYLNLNVFVGYSYFARYTIFFFFITVCFALLFLPQYLWLSYKPLAEEVRNRQLAARSEQMGLPNHNPEDVRLVRELAFKLMPPVKKGLMSPHDLPIPSKLIDELRVLTDYKKGGYFFEVGSGDKDLFSDTLFLETRMGWTGLLVEPDPINMKVFRRNAWIAPACMSLNNSAYEFHRQPYIRYHGHDPRGSTNYSPKVICYPFYTFWLALNRPVVDYFALDVGGGEVEILETIPFSKVDIKIVHVDFTKARSGFMGVTTLMQRNGYKVVSEVLPDFLLFIKKEYVNTYKDI